MSAHLPSIYNWLVDNTLIVLYTVFVLWLLSQLRRLSRSLIAAAPVFVRRLRRKNQRKFLAQIREFDRDPALVQLAINRSGVYLVLFWTCTATWMLMSLVLALSPVEMQKLFRPYQLISSLPMYAFEIAWLNKSFLLDDFFNRRKKLAARKNQKTRTTSNDLPITRK